MDLSRRRFVHLVGSAAGVVAAAPVTRAIGGTSPSAPTDPSAPLSLGFSLYGMKALPVAVAIATCARIGYRNVELSLIPGFETEPAALTAAKQAEVSEALGGAGLTASALLTKLDLSASEDAYLAQVEDLQRGAAFARALHPAQPPPVQTTLGGADAAWATQQGSFVQRLRHCAEAVAAAGGTLAVKAHALQAVNSPERLRWLLDGAAHPALAVAFDHAHFSLLDIPMERSISLLSGHIRYVHVKDAARSANGPRFLLPGTGQTDFHKLFRLLVRSGYRGAVVAEVSQQLWSAPGYDPVAAARACYEALAPLLPPATDSPA
jgi:sugar phosphate isomerase/epimerase